ncbi:putative peptidylprolyl isomerase [Helianthus annuus]|nr:putative peptidylprolyl isomerase [Helianthus annuus]
MKSIQNSFKELSYLLRIPQRKPYGTMEGNVKKALKEGIVEIREDYVEEAFNEDKATTAGQDDFARILSRIAEEDQRVAR